MRVLIVSAHPEPRSFNVAMRRSVEEHFRRRGDDVVLSDLHAMRFDPVASGADFGDRRDPDYLVYALEQRAAWKAGTIAPDIRREVQRLLRAELVVFVFPIYWFSVPAILKGWLDRVLLSGLTYGGRSFYDRGPLRGKRAAIVTSMGSREHMFGAGSIHGDLITMLRPILRGTLQYTGMEVLPPFVAWHVPYVSDEERRARLGGLRRWLEELDQQAPLPMPSLSDFDEDVRPRAANRSPSFPESTTHPEGLPMPPRDEPRLVLLRDRPELASEFTRLNYDWIQEFFRIEDSDRAILDDPWRSVIEPGGEVLFLCERDQVVATCALITGEGGSLELAKMAVAHEVRGRGLGQVLMEAAIEAARERGAPRLHLVSNTELRAALNLYLKNGFEITEAGPHPYYERGNIAMELDLGAAAGCSDGPGPARECRP